MVTKFVKKKIYIYVRIVANRTKFVNFKKGSRLVKNFLNKSRLVEMGPK